MEHFYKTQWADQINPIDVNFYLQKSLEMFDKTSADKIWSKKKKEWKVSPVMPIRVNRMSERQYVCQRMERDVCSIKIKLGKIAHRVLCLFKSRKLLESTELIGTTFVVLTRRRGWRTRTGSSSIFFFHIGHGDGSTAPREVTAEAGCPPRIWRLCTLVNVSPVSGGSIISHTCIAGHLICFISKDKQRSTSLLLQSISMDIQSHNYYIFCVQCNGRSRVIGKTVELFYSELAADVCHDWKAWDTIHVSMYSRPILS